MIKEEVKKVLEKQGYRFCGDNSAIKVCEWCKKAILGEDVCYKNTFYGIKSWRCVQMTPSLSNCTHLCSFCWRDLNYTDKNVVSNPDNPKEVVDNAIKQHVKYLRGFGGNKKRDQKRFEEALKPLHFAISLAGEPTLYPKLGELIQEIHKRGMTTFVVSNGTNPEELLKLKNNLPTQLYLTLPAPNEEVYKNIDRKSTRLNSSHIPLSRMPSSA